MKETLGAFVVLMPLNRLTPFWRMTTRHFFPTTFWSTSNSVSMRPPSTLAFSFQFAEPEHEPCLITRAPPPFAGADETAASAATASTMLATPISFHMRASFSFAPISTARPLDPTLRPGKHSPVRGKIERHRGDGLRQSLPAHVVAHRR